MPYQTRDKIEGIMQSNHTNESEEQKIFNKKLQEALLEECTKEDSNLQNIKKLIEQGANPSDEDKYRCNSLERVCYANPSPEIIEYLIQKKVNPNKIHPYDGTTILHNLFIKHTLKEELLYEAIETLLKAGADPNIVTKLIDEYGRTCLHRAVKWNTVTAKLIDLFSKYGGDFNIKDQHGYTVLHYLLHVDKIYDEEPNFSLIHLVLDQKIDLNITADKHNITYFQYACLQKPLSLPLIKKFIALGSDPNSQLKDGRNCLHLVCSKHVDLETLKYLIDDQKMDPNAKTNGGKTCLNVYLQYNNNLEIIKYLAENHCSPTEQTKNGRNSLHLACHKKASLDVIKYLVDELKIDPNIKTSTGKTCFDIAIRNGASSNVLDYFMKKNIDLLPQHNENNSYLHLACEYNPILELLKYLIDKNGANPKQQDKYGNTCLHIACEYSATLDVLRYLIEEKKVDPKLVNKNQGTCLHKLFDERDVFDDERRGVLAYPSIYRFLSCSAKH